MNPENLLDDIETEVTRWVYDRINVFEIRNTDVVRLTLSTQALVYERAIESVSLIPTGSTIMIIKYDDMGERTKMQEGTKSYLEAIDYAIEQINIVLRRIEDQNLENFKTIIEASGSKK